MKTKKEIAKLVRWELLKDILERYDNPEYWDMELAKDIIKEEGIVQEEEKEEILEMVENLDREEIL